MNGDVKIFYGDKDVFSEICPTPFLYFDKEYIKYGSDWGSRYNLTIEGKIIGHLDSMRARLDLEYKKNLLIDNFKQDNLPISITDDGSIVFRSDICSIESINFEESSYYAILPFTISAFCYDSASFGSNYGILNPQDIWDYSENLEGKVYLKHNVSANGYRTEYDNGISNAKEWVKSKTGINKRIDSLNIKNINISNFIIDSISESVDRFNGKYSIEEVYVTDLLNSGESGILRYTVECSKDFSDGITKVLIDGSVGGRDKIKNINNSNMDSLRYRFFSEDFFNIATNDAIKSTGTDKLNAIPYSRRITENETESLISFSLSYDDNQIAPGVAKCIYKVDISEDLVKNITEVKIDAEITCDRGDEDTRWNAIKSYFYQNFNAYSLAVKEYKFMGYSKGFNEIPVSENLVFDEFNKKINYSATWNDKRIPSNEKDGPCHEAILSISEQVNIESSVDIYAVQSSYNYDGIHNIQKFGCASRTIISISISATAKNNKSINDVKSCVYSELSRLKRIYVKNKNLIVDQRSETIDEEHKKISINYSYSFEGDIVK